MAVYRLCFLIFLFTLSVKCAKILGVFYTPSTSHYILGSTLMRILAERGHEVTVISPFVEDNPPKKYTEIYLDGLIKDLQNGGKPAPNPFKNKKGLFNMAWITNSLSAPLVNKTMAHPEFQRFLRSNSTFDLVILEQFSCDALQYLATHFGSPLILFSSLDANHFSNRYIGNPTFPAYIPEVLSDFHRMSFWQRMQNTLVFLLKEILFQIQIIPTQNQILHEYIPGAPHLRDFIYNASAIFLNADVSVHDAIPKVPGMINIGGFHVNTTKTLPKDLQEILDNATTGVVYFSMGSTVKSKDMEKEQLEAILGVLSKINETVIWKWEDDNLPGKPPNVLTRKWLPQQEILGHKNVKLFISHGGLLSIIESIYYGVPMLIIPIKADQHSNAARAEDGGYAISMEFSEITASSFATAVSKLTTDPKYRENAMQRSLVMREKPISARDTIVFWVENIIKNRGAPHLRVASLDMPWYQYALLDVIGFFALITIVFILVIVYVIKYSCKLCRSDKSMRKINYNT